MSSTSSGAATTQGKSLWGWRPTSGGLVAPGSATAKRGARGAGSRCNDRGTEVIPGSAHRGGSRSVVGGATTGGPGSFRGGPIRRHPHHGGAGRSFVGTVTTGRGWAFQPAGPASQPPRGRVVGRGAAIVRMCNDPGPAMIPAHGCDRSQPQTALNRPAADSPPSLADPKAGQNCPMASGSTPQATNPRLIDSPSRKSGHPVRSDAPTSMKSSRSRSVAVRWSPPNRIKRPQGDLWLGAPTPRRRPAVHRHRRRARDEVCGRGCSGGGS